MLGQLYVQACCSIPPHPNVCRLLGWGSPSSEDGTLDGLKEGAVVYMVQENAGTEISDRFAPHQAYRYLKQIVKGTPIASLAVFILLSSRATAVWQVCITCTARISTTAT